MHKSTIDIFFSNRKTDCSTTSVIEYTAPSQVPKPISRVINKEEEGSSPFSAEYVGGDKAPSIAIVNKTVKQLNLVFGGVSYMIPSYETKTITAESVTYNFTASAIGIRPLKGTKGFEQGYRYTWTFVILTGR